MPVRVFLIDPPIKKKLRHFLAQSSGGQWRRQ